MERWSAQERDGFRASIRGTLERRWGAATAARDGAPAMALAWKDAVELGWADLGPALGPAIVLAEELGRAACPLPLADTEAARLLFATDPDVRATVVEAGGELAEAGELATHAVVLGDEAASLRPIRRHEPAPGLAAPPWSRVELDGPVATTADQGVVAAARRRHRLVLVGRAMGAARRGHELAVEHARTRVQFGRPIGAFQAVSHRLADAAVDLAGWDALVEVCETDSRAVDAAIEHGRGAAVRVMRAAQRTLAATGYFEEHELPWLFRRMHADLVHQQALGCRGDDLGRVVLTDGLPEPALGPGPTAAAAELETTLDALGLPESTDFDDDPKALEALGADGWIAPGLPVALGGRDADVATQMAIDAVMQRRRVPVRVARGVAATLAGVIQAHGSPEQRAEFLPRIAAGRFRCYLGYSEPEAGSDLASLRTTARRDGDEWVINGIKLWGTGAHTADHVWLAARTNPDERRHAGITVFLAPTRLPGWSVVEHRALSGEVSCTTVFDDVRIPDSCRIGPVDGGWPVITSALAAERVVMAGLAAEVGRQFDDLVHALGAAGTCDDTTAARLAPLAARLQVARALVAACANDESLWLEAAMAKLVTSELAEEVAGAALELLGARAATGPFDHALRLAPMYVIGGGTADIQRNLIGRGLALPGR